MDLESRCGLPENTSQYCAWVFDPKTDVFEDVADDLERLEIAADVGNRRHKREQLRRWFSDERSAAIFARDESGKNVGFVLAIPTIAPETAHIMVIVVEDEHRHHKLSWMLHDSLIDRLRELGYSQLLGEYRTRGDFAQHVQARYNGQVTDQRELSEVGHQLVMTIPIPPR